MENIADDVEWITPGNRAISGTLRGKEEVGKLWTALAAKGFTTTLQYWFADDERVVVLTQTTVEGGEADGADVLTCRRREGRQVANRGRHRPAGAGVRV